MTIAEERQDISVSMVAFTDVLADRGISLVETVATSPAFTESEKTEFAEAINHVLTGFKQLKPMMERLRAEYLGDGHEGLKNG